MSLRISSRADASGAPLAPEPDPPPYWATALALGCAVLLQTEVGPWFALRGATPSFVLLFVMWYGLRTGAAQGLLVGAIAGACEDALAGWTGGAWTIATATLGALAGRSAGTFVSESRAWLVGWAGLGTLLRYAIFVVALGAEGRTLALPEAHAHAIVWQAALDAALAFVVLTFFPQTSVSRVGLR